MFGNSYFGARFWGDRYWGQGLNADDPGYGPTDFSAELVDVIDVEAFDDAELES